MNRVSALGELSSSIAHEVNQPLTGITSNGSACLRWLATDVPNLEEVRGGLRDIVRDGKRAGEIIARIRGLAKKAPPTQTTLDLNETVREVLALVAEDIKRKNLALTTEFAEHLAPVLGDRVQLQQVVLNLVVNAIDAMSNTTSKQLVVATCNDEAGLARVVVQDTGTGLDPNAIEKIFEPFYSTKPGGMGMGLSISRSIVEYHGGILWATANQGTGTSIQFTIPQCSGAQVAVQHEC